MTRITAVALMLLVGAGALAGPPPKAPPKRKPAGEAYSLEALNKFVDAIIADKAGELRDAERAYEKSIEASPQPNSYYNLADLQRRMERLDKAIATYQKYLEVAPSAPDKQEVLGIIDQLQHSPGTLVVDGDEPHALVLVDGKVVGPSPQVLQLPAGEHMADRIAPTGMRGQRVKIENGKAQHIQLSVGSYNRDKADDGNVVFSASPDITMSGSWNEGATRFRLPGKVALAPGHYVTQPFGRYACNTIAFDVQPGKHITYVYLEGTAKTPDGCVPMRAYAQKLVLP